MKFYFAEVIFLIKLKKLSLVLQQMGRVLAQKFNYDYLLQAVWL